MPLSIPANDLLLWNDTSAAKWCDLVRAHPKVLALPCDIRNSGDVAHFLQHIVVVELRYAQRLAAEPESPYEEILFGSADEIFATHQAAISKVQPLIDDPTFDWSLEIEFQTITMGRLRATRRDVLVHMLMHSIRHYAQLATLVRSADIKPDWPMDFLFVNARPSA